MLSRILSNGECVLDAATAEEASARFMHAARSLGATYLQTRVYRRPQGRLTSASHYAAGGVVTRIASDNWPDSEAFNYVCFDCNPLLGAIREGRTRYAFSDFAPRGSQAFGAYWDALGEAGIADALCATSYGAGGTIASLHLGFGARDFSPDERLTIQLAGLVLTERLMSLADPAPDESSPLTPRERDSLALVAEGKTDWEISMILGVSEATARFHVDNARRKLDAVSRAQAVAKMIDRRLI